MAWNLDKSEYLFVKGRDVDATHPYGDMDRLKTSFNLPDLIRGRIMPKRQGWAKPGIARGTHILSGEDICFLSEGVREREVLTTTSAMATTDVGFSRIISANGVQSATESFDASPGWVARQLRTLAPKFVKTLPTASTKPQYDTADADLFEMYTVADLASSPNDFTNGGGLSQANVMKLFTDEKKLNTGRVAVTGYYSTSQSSIINNYDSTTPVDDPGYDLGIYWYGGTDESGTGGSTHAHGGFVWNTCTLREWVELPNVPAAMTPASGYVYINWHLRYIERDAQGTLLRNETCTFWEEANQWNWNPSVKWAYLWHSGGITVLRKVASEKFGWDPTTLPDEYGTKYLMVDGHTAWLTFAVDHTDY